MRRYINIKREDREFIMKAFGVTARTVYNAINYDPRFGHSELARKIRRLAMDRGGEVMVEAPEVETLHDADGYMRQYLPGDVVLEFSKQQPVCVVRHGACRVCTIGNVLLSDVAIIQHFGLQIPRMKTANDLLEALDQVLAESHAMRGTEVMPLRFEKGAGKESPATGIGLDCKDGAKVAYKEASGEGAKFACKDGNVLAS